MKQSLLALFVLLATTLSLAKDKPQYQVGVFVAQSHMDSGAVTQQTDDGLFGGGGVTTKNIGYEASLVDVPEGRYAIDPPSSVAGAILFGGKIDTHKAWFMDDLHEGDKVLFSAQCDKHGRCQIQVPNPEKPDRVFHTVGHFYPNVAKSNTNVLCGRGKLSAAMEAELCGTAAKPQSLPAPGSEAK